MPGTFTQEYSPETLERELGLKELQINRLLNITQAINENRSARELFEMYANFLNWDLGIRRMALYFQRDGHWECRSFIGLTDGERMVGVSECFDDYQVRGPISDDGHPLLCSFDFVIPVTHKNQNLVYVFLGDLSDAPEASARVQLVTTITHVVAVAIENKRLFKQQLEQERYQAEFALASEIQRSLVPDHLPSGPHFDMAALYLPRFGVGGDFYSAEYVRRRTTAVLRGRHRRQGYWRGAVHEQLRGIVLVARSLAADARGLRAGPEYGAVSRDARRSLPNAVRRGVRH